MKITKVCCQGCGADLQIDETIRFATCNYCHARLEIVHDPMVTHTRLLEDIERNTEEIADNLRIVELQNELERLDRDWESRPELFKPTSDKFSEKRFHRLIEWVVTRFVACAVTLISIVIIAALCVDYGTWGAILGVLATAGAVAFLVWYDAKKIRKVTTGEDDAKTAFNHQRSYLVCQIEAARRNRESADYEEPRN